MVDLVDRSGEVLVSHQGCREDAEDGIGGWNREGLFGRWMEVGRDGVVMCGGGYRTDAQPPGIMLDGFDVSLSGWGLRGAPYARRALRERLAYVPTPSNARNVEALVYETFEELTGIDLRTETAEAGYTEQFAHGGMSSGHQHIEWWRDEPIPLIVARATRPETDVL